MTPSLVAHLQGAELVYAPAIFWHPCEMPPDPSAAQTFLFCALSRARTTDRGHKADGIPESGGKRAASSPAALAL
ncbi:MAG: hypothetical protein Kow001_12940 [Acidobacteriota bacterium]